MDSLKLYENVCRICLNQNVKLGWNDEIFEFCGISYKDCYFKYTKLEECDSDCYPTYLCEICANGLKNAHILFEKSVESFNILQNVFKNNQNEYSEKGGCDSLHVVKCDIEMLDEANSGMIIEDELIDASTLIEIVDERYVSPVCDTEKIVEIENAVIDSEQLLHNDVEPRYFIDIKRLESIETPLELRVSEFPDDDTKKTNKKRKKHTPLSDTSMEQQLTKPSDIKLSKLSITKKTSNRKVCQSFTEISSLQEYNTECSITEVSNSSATEKSSDNIDTIASLEKSVTETFKTKPVRSTKKSREKYLLLCQYCSLQVLGAGNLARHEATHSENRQRTEICPKCGIKLYTKLSLNQHMKIHDENRQKTHKCEFCGNAFFDRGSLNVHRRKHLGLMVKCQLCSKEFLRQVDLDKHLLTHSASPLQKNVGKKKYAVQCQYCNKSIVTIKYKEHIAAHLDQPQVKCKICDKNFFSRRSVTKHLHRFHQKKSNEYEDCIHYYVERKSRVSILMMKQQLNAHPLPE